MRLPLAMAKVPTLLLPSVFMRACLCPRPRCRDHSRIALAISGEESDNRYKNVADDFLADGGAISYVGEAFKKYVMAHNPDQRLAAAFRSTLAKSTEAALSLFVEFVTRGEVQLNGKLIRQYSSFRSETQQMVIASLRLCLASLPSVPLGPRHCTV
jgi:hypothetical protein